MHDTPKVTQICDHFLVINHFRVAVTFKTCSRPFKTIVLCNNCGLFPLCIIAEIIYRSSHPKVFYKKCFLKCFAKFTGKHQPQSLLLNIFKNTFFIEHLWETISQYNERVQHFGTGLIRHKKAGGDF